MTTRNQPYFEHDSCANCSQALPDEQAALFCSQACRQQARLVRYWRAVTRDGRLERPDVAEAIHTRVAFVLAGGYHQDERRLPASIYQQIRERDSHLCVTCGNPGEEVDHIEGDSSDLSNLQLLCKKCHQAKTAERFHPASPEETAAINLMYVTRVEPDLPTRLCDDEQHWRERWRELKTSRRQRLVDQMEDEGLNLNDFRGATREEMITELQDAICVAAESGSWTEDDDSGYGPYSYFARAMAKND